MHAATRAFARGGFAATSLDAIAAEAGVTRVILYRHFDSKEELYRHVLERVHERLTRETRGADGYDAGSVEGLIAAAAADPAGFKLYFRHAAREPEFRPQADRLAKAMRDRARPYLAETLQDRRLLDWAVALVPVVAIETVIAWLDAGQPNQPRVAEAVLGILGAATAAIRSTAGDEKQTNDSARSGS
ncbi:MAG: TetR/AcrR family transcriptional regulator [Candidatus Dormibacteria bacterium]